MLYAQDLRFIVTFCIQLLSVGKSVVFDTQGFVSYTIIELTLLSLCINCTLRFIAVFSNVLLDLYLTKICKTYLILFIRIH